MSLGVFRRIRHWSAIHAVLARLVAGYLRFVRRTGRWEILGEAPRAQAMSYRGRLILACWHGRLAMLPTERVAPGAIAAVISRNADGDVLSQIMERFEIDTLRGSSEDPDKPWRRRGGREVFNEALAALRNTADLRIAVTPDGPRGPRMRCHPGVALLSARAGVPVVPFAFSARWGWVLGSWDRFMLPLPFTRGVICWGAPLHPPPPMGEGANAATGTTGAPDPARETLKTYAQRIEAAMNDLLAQADARMGRPSPPQG
ncbi:MAG: lysophospholipid acyltransferase family protein [Pseudomonadota bacterium]